MTTLYPIPWQPRYLLTRDTLDLLGAASERAGHDIEVVDAFRVYDEQKALYNGYINHIPGFNLASNPDDPNAQNNHLRAAAVDIKNHADVPYMLAVGFTQDSVEWWHFNNPNWRNMPIIHDYTTVAALAAQPIQEEEMAQKLYEIISAHESASKYLRHPGGVSPIKNTVELAVVERFVSLVNEEKPIDMFDTQLQTINAIQKR
jgi:hypothetical protein